MVVKSNEQLYTKGTRVWVPDPDNVWIGAELLEDLKDDQLELGLEDGREVVLDLKVTKSLPPLRNPDILVGSNDLTTLSYLHEPAVLYNLQERFLNSQCIYTYCGIVLVALNPYQNVPLYGQEIISAYSGKQSHEIDPHIYAVAENAYRNMLNLNQNQSIIVSGESGAGKTVSAKFAMRYFANVGGSISESTVEKKVLASNPIMEAIGNAKTIRNDNSSRFGKYIQINFDASNSIIGANMRTYLLEKSRVVFQAANERNYHIFHQLCACQNHPDLQDLQLGESSEFYYTQQGENPNIPGVDDAKNFQETCEALSMLGIYSEQQRMIWRILAAILHLGNVSIEVTSKKNDECGIRQEDVHLMMVATLLGIDKNQLRKWLCARKIVATGDVYVKPLTFAEANNGRDALAKHIYSMLFKWIVEHINSSLVTTIQRKSFIGVLDIYGFETFEVNSFEQFCINYANEKLQQQFNMHVFKLEQEEYIREQITWSFIDFYDNQSCIDLIEIKLGILDLLDEECRMPKGSDSAWALKLYKQHLKTSDHFIKPRMSEKAFIIRHYADDVIYDCDGFVEKNRDLINEEHINLLCASEYELVGELFRSENTASTQAPRKRTTSRVGKSAPKGKKTVGSEFRDSLKMLMDTLNSTSPHYVRCIKSNDAKEAFQLDLHRCVQQLRACGVLETIRISAAGYPSRWTYNEFFDRYRMLIPWKRINWDSLNDTCNTILSSHIDDEDKFQLGKTKIFFRAGAVAYLERLRSDLLKRSCIAIQKNIKCWLACKKFQRMRKSATAIQCFVRVYQAKRLVQSLRERRAAIRIQKSWRGYSTRQWYLKTRDQIIQIQAQIRGVLARRRLRAKIQQIKSVIIQKYWRMYKARKEYQKTLKGIILIQCCVRRMAARKELKRLKIEARSVEHLKKQTKGMEIKVISLQQKLNAELQEKKELKGKIEHMATLEKELHKVQEMKPQLDELTRTQEKLKTEKEELEKQKLIDEEKTKTLEDKLTSVEKTKDEEIASLKEALAALQKSFTEQTDRNELIIKERDELITKRLEEQKEQLTSEFTAERASHQKMIGEYARLEQRFDNLQQELQMEKTSPDKRRRSQFDSESFEVLSTKDSIKPDDEVIISENIGDIGELTRERDLLLEQVELLKEEQNFSMHVHEVEEKQAHRVIDREKDDLLNENQRLVRELDILREAAEGNNTEQANNKAISKLLVEIKELRHENILLRKKATIKENGLGPPTHSTSSVSEISDNNNLSDAAQKEVSRLTMDNIRLREEIDLLKEKFKEMIGQNKMMSRQNSSSSVNNENIGLGSRTRSNVTELTRKRSQTIEARISEGNLSEAGKLLMTYAGLSRKKQNDQKAHLSNDKKAEKKLGMVKFSATTQDDLVRKLVTDLNMEHVEKEMPGLTAHIMFMSIRYIDYVNQERLMQSYLTAIISSIKKRATEKGGDIDNQAFWLANTYRLYCNMKQFSGEQQFQGRNTREQNEHCLMNFDLSEYRQVLSDACVKIYQDMVHNVQTRINKLIVPGMLEYESIPGVVSTLRRFKNEQIKRSSEEIITVKDITNKLSAILAVLNAHCVEPSLIKQIFRQIYYFINATMINNILLRKDMCHWSRGLQIKFNLTQLEEWCRTNQLHGKNVVEQLEPITEVVQLLQVNKKSLEDVDGIIAIVKHLNALQVQKLLSMYSPNEFEPRVPGNLIRTVVSKLPKLDNMILMYNLKHVTPMTVGYVPSNVNLEKVVIPPGLEINDLVEVI